MKLLRSLLVAIVLGLSFAPVAGCYLDEVAVDEPAVIYRAGFGYGYWYNSYWYGAPIGFRYYNGCRPYWGPHYYAPRPYYRPGPYRGGYGGYRGGYGHGGFRGGGHR